ncbi:hypothetical protein C5C71_01895 [Rathayibacter sp. AY1C1]|uniref:hypothetical protein n=1 Tax=Rathayibacter sp. AY1C1 TaxID=2080534 RepID=UPI000CE8DB6B|nr:hypothetical protein [Rathayibacter sp. AY1C1]PPH13326.1 hypothetical protein C5C71_01895 [Rathayibacter sp. AY1C1]
MGSNRRYEDHYDRLRQQRVTEAAVRPVPVSLTSEELDVANHPVQRGPAVPVRAWVRFKEQPVITEAFAVEWNDRAVHVEWSMSDGTKLDAWGWANAVRRI